MELFSSPRMIDPDDFGLGSESSNKARLAELKAMPSKQVGTHRGISLIEYTKTSNESFIVFEFQEKIIYLVHAQVEHFKQFKANAVTQVEVWRTTRHDDLLRGLAVRVFFNILLKRYKYIVSDQLQTTDGKKFWERMLDNAITRGYSAGFFHDNLPTVDWAIPEAFDAWLRYQASYNWGHDSHSQHMRFVITSQAPELK